MGGMTFLNVLCCISSSLFLISHLNFFLQTCNLRPSRFLSIHSRHLILLDLFRF